MPLIETKGSASAQGFGFTLGGAEPVYIEQIFSTWLYTGNDTARTINNGIDLAGKGGLVWTKSRSSGSFNHILVDTVRGAGKGLFSDLTNAQNASMGGLTGFTSTGYELSGSVADLNSLSQTFASWTFREQPKFFDVVTWTGTGIVRTVSHNLGSTPGCIIVKAYSGTNAGIENWTVYHRSLGGTKALRLNTTGAELVSDSFWNDTDPTSTVFTVADNGAVNGNGLSYVAYLFAHNAGGFGLTGTDNVISCGSFTTNGSGAATVNLGYEPQFVMFKRTDGVGDWFLVDVMRGFTSDPTSGQIAFLYPNTSAAEGVASGIGVTSTGFVLGSWFASQSYIYIAIRRGPMKTPTTGTSVFSPVSYSGTGTTNSITSGFTVDAEIVGPRTVVRSWKSAFASRLTGTGRYLTSSSTAVEQTDGPTEEFATNNGVLRSGTGMNSTADSPLLTYMLQRAPGFFDVVCYTGNGSTQTIAHNLGVVPELIIAKNRGQAGNNWPVLFNFASTTMNYGFLNLTNSCPNDTYANVGVFSAAPTSTNMFLTNSGSMNASGFGIVAYLFASCSGVSKVTNFTGTGTLQTINCGFTGGARFVLIKRTDAVGDWYVWDSARGLSSANDPYLLLNSTAAEVTTTNWVDTTATGFQVTAAAGNNVNINGASYIALAIA